MKRDLKADLETVEKAKQFAKVKGWGSREFHELSPYFSKFHEEGLDITGHAIKRAIKAEALLEEALKALETIVVPTYWVEQFEKDSGVTLDEAVVEQIVNDPNLFKTIAVGALVMVKEALMDDDLTFTEEGDKQWVD